MFTTNEIRNKYLKFFEDKGCRKVKSSSLVPNDPTLLFTNAGMVQFKNYLKGTEKPKFTKAVSVQKCIRAGGKHNDLDNVGYTARHHTFFEMLGNFSFGDYFKREAIEWAWEFLTNELLIPQEKLLATVYYNDEEAYKIWRHVIGLDEERIIKIPNKNNFWEMGNTGPCGPCSEIFYDHGPSISGGKPGTKDEDGDRYIEIWNIVFTQFNRNDKGDLEELPSKNIDTGMGLERIAAVLQGVHNNFETDIFKKLIKNSENIIGIGDIFAHRIIADHLRSSSFLICDGIFPSNEGRGYVLRRIMRRSMLQIHKLGAKKASMYKLVPCLIDIMSDAYPELSENEKIIMETLENEENKFKSTLDNGIKILEEKVKNLDSNIMSGYDAFELYDTYGFPLDLTEMLLREKNININIDEFDEEMNKQKDRARSSWIGSGDKSINDLYLKLEQKTNFVGYEKNNASARIINIIKDGKFIDNATSGENIEIITDVSCFYGEKGGQVGDSGLFILIKDDGTIPLPFSVIEISDTQIFNDTIIHKGKVEIGSFKIGDRVNMSINLDKRAKISANHSATHLLHFALKILLGNSVNQKGSFVNENGLRLDVSYNGKIEKEILNKVEEIVNDIIIKNTKVTTELMPIEEAKKSGAIALFNEKYGNFVRVVSMGEYKTKTNKNFNNNLNKSNYTIQEITNELNNFENKTGILCSKELCGGTHVKNTGDIGFFKIIKEESIASGIRRIEACTGLKALDFIRCNLSIVDELSNIFKISKENIVDKVNYLILENKELKKINSDLKKNTLSNIEFNKMEKNGINILNKNFDNVDPQDIKGIVVNLKNTKYKNNTIICASCNNKNKKICMVAVSNDITEKYNATEILKNLGVHGGGANGFAMGSFEGILNFNKVI